MIRKLVAVLVLLPLGLLIVAFAVANRQRVPVSLDPFASDAPALTVSLPLFLLILGTLIAGVIVGGGASWLRGERWGAGARAAGQAKRLRADNDALKRELEAAASAPAPGTAIASIAYRHPSAA
ncbi:MAG: LapA family protein [Xanthobacteraceae bacterium]|nr:LapA family protein [Xanthobacteraceae bacterium]